MELSIVAGAERCDEVSDRRESYSDLRDMVQGLKASSLSLPDSQLTSGSQTEVETTISDFNSPERLRHFLTGFLLRKLTEPVPEDLLEAMS